MQLRAQPLASGRLALALLCAAGLAGCVVPERRFDQDEADRHSAATQADDSTTDDSTTDDAEPSGAGGAGPMGSDVCQEYCDTVMESCSGDFAVYASVDSCLAVCAMLPLEDDDGDNTVACRLEQAMLAKSTGERDEHCPPAGPGGSSARGRARCGSNCESYCLLQPQACSSTDELILEQAECERRCSALVDAQSFDVTVHHDADNVQCRLVHVSSAALSETAAQTHCWHASIAPEDDSPCGLPADSVPECDHYCSVVMTACVDENAVYDDEAQCQRACAEFEPGTARGMGVNTIGCRLHYAYESLEEPADNCAFAGPGGDGKCGDNCESYCSLAEGICSGAFDERFGTSTDEECSSACSSEDGAEDGSGYQATVAEDTPGVACRLHAVLTSGGTAAECRAALGDGDCGG